MPSFMTPWRAVAAMFLLNGSLLGIWGSRIPSLTAKHGLEHGEFGRLLLVMAAGAIASFAVTGGLADRIGGSRLTRMIAVTYGLSLVLISFAPVNFYALGFFMILFGIAHGGMDVAINAWATEVEKVADKPIMSSFHAMWSVGLGLGALSGYVAGLIDLSIGLHFILAAVIFSALCLPWSLIRWDFVDDSPASESPLVSLPRGPLLLVGLVAFCTTIGEGGMADWSAIFLVEVTQSNEGRAALGLSAFSALMVATRFAGDRIIARFGPVAVTRFSGVIAGCGALLAVVGGTYVTALLGFALMGIGYATIVPMAFSRAAVEPGVKAGTAIASVATLGYGGILLGPVIIGQLSDWVGIRYAFILMIVLAFLMSALAPSMRRKSD